MSAATMRRYCVRYIDGPLEGFTFSWYAERGPTVRLAVEGGSYALVGQDRKSGWWAYRWEPAA